MSKLIRVPDSVIAQYVTELTNKIKSTKMFDGKLAINQTFELKESPVAKLHFSETAFAKILALVIGFDSEIAWHGTVHKEEDANYFIDDIVVYPQEVTGTTVNTDQEEYTSWLYELPDAVFNNLRMQGHSHVNMSTSPSATDEDNQTQILAQLDDSMFYIFMIINKRMEMTIKIYDLADNILYEDKDIETCLGSDDLDIAAFTAGAKALVKRKTYTYSGGKGKKSGKTNTSSAYPYATGISFSGYGYDDYD